VRTPPEVYLDSQDSYRDPACRIDIAAMNKMQDMQVELGFQKDKVDVTKVVDLSWLPK
jgi:Holliday junction resolvase-like predicted endonuclease